MPPEYSPAGRSAASASPKRSSSSSARRRAARGAQVVEAAEHDEVLPSAEDLVDRRVLPDEPDPRAHLRRLAHHVAPGDAGGARRPA